MGHAAGQGIDLDAGELGRARDVVAGTEHVSGGDPTIRPGPDQAVECYAVVAGHAPYSR